MTSLMLTAGHKMAAQVVVLSPPLSRRFLTKRTISRRKVAIAAVHVYVCMHVWVYVRACECVGVHMYSGMPRSLSLSLSLSRAYVRACVSACMRAYARAGSAYVILRCY